MLRKAPPSLDRGEDVMSSMVRVGLTAVLLAGLPGVAAAQFPPPQPPAGSSSSSVQDRWPDPPKPQTAAPSRPQAQPAAPRNKPAPASAAAPPDADAAAQPKPAPRPAAAANVVACGGVFGKDSTHLKLAIKYDSRNIVFGDVDGPDGSKIKASVLFPNDPKRRLEVVWNNDASRSDMSVIAINGKSQWVAPKGLKLGLTLPAIEKANGRPFKVGGFGADGSASVLGWEGGALSALPGGCKVGIRLVADSKASQDARSAVAVDKGFLSNDASVLAVKPSVGEILIGY
jgi:hypothetical protein